jgi:cytochrome c oxidase cbb3-type subunit 1
MYVIRAFGGVLYLAGGVVMVINVWRTILGHYREEAPMSDAAFDPARDRPIVGSAAASHATPAE